MAEEIDKDAVYLNHISNALNEGSRGRLTYLGFLVTINMAIYTAIHLLEPKDLWAISGSKLFLIMLLIFVNGAFSWMYLREHNLAQSRDDKFLKYLKKGETCPEEQICGDCPPDKKNKGNVACHIENEVWEFDKKWRGHTWIATKLLMSTFNAIPMGFFLVLIFISPFRQDSWQRFWAIEVTFGFFILIICVLIYQYIHLKECPRK
jgi:hypothetical protein